MGRKISTQWHPDWRLPTRIAGPGTITTYVFNGQPDPFNGGATANCAPAATLLPDGRPIAVLCKRVTQATTDGNGHSGFSAPLQAGMSARIWSYAYNRDGQLLTATDPRNNATTYAYYGETTADHTVGDLSTVTDALGHVTKYTKYNPYGQVLQMVDPNGITTDATYDLRQRATGVSVAGQTTSYEYWPTGLLKQVTFPDGSWLAYGYDDAHRLNELKDNAGNSVHYTLDNSGSRIGEEVRDPTGTLKQQIGRAMDALHRVQQTVGRE
jgi:YD repeat-containing protein